MVRTPYTSDRVLNTRHRLLDSLQLLPASISQQLRLLQYLFLFQIPHTDSLLAVRPGPKVMGNDNWMFTWSWRDAYFDRWVCGCESGEGVA